MNYDAIISQYRSLISSLNSAIGEINNGNTKLKKIPDTLEAGLLVNGEILEEDQLSTSLSENNTSIAELRSAIGCCYESIAKYERLKREEEARRRAEEAERNSR